MSWVASWGGMVGLILAVPFRVILTTGIERMRTKGYVETFHDGSNSHEKTTNGVSVGDDARPDGLC